MSEQRPKRIHLLGSGRHEEGIAGATITPGMLIALNSDGEYIPHGTSGIAAERNFALEDALQGRTIADNYTEGELVGFVACVPGDVVFAFLADGEVVDIGDKLVSNGDGRLQKLNSSEIPLGVALEAIDLSESENIAAARIRVRLL